MDEFDAYAPPVADSGKAAPKKRKKKSAVMLGAVADAIDRLNEHLADANAVALDRQEIGGKLRRPTIVFVVLTVLMGLVALVTIGSRETSFGMDPIVFASALLAGFLLFITIILVAVDLQFASRDVPTSPENTTKYFFKAIAMARFGYAWATLCPTAREQSVETPSLGPIPVGEGTFTLRRPNDLKDYTATFARPGNGQMRTMQIKRAELVNEDGDVATVEVTAVFQSWPQWAQLISVVAFVVIRLIGIILFLILFFSLRKNHEVTFRKTLIRGSNGIWYVYSPDVLEGSVHTD